MKFHTHTLRSLALLTGVSSLTRAFSVGRPSSAAFLRTANPHFAVADPNLSPFRTWTFDTPCASMAWNSLPSATISTTLTLNETSDLILLGVHNKTLTGLAKSIDEQLQGAFTEMVQKKTFKGKVGNTTPMIQVFVNGKVRRFKQYTYTHKLFCPLQQSHIDNVPNILTRTIILIFILMIEHQVRLGRSRR